MTVWEQRDLPVLQALATSEDENLRYGFLAVSGPRSDQLGVELSAGELHEAILTLRDAGYVEGDVQYEGSGGAVFTHLLVTGRGQQAVGEWPLFDDIASPETLALLLKRLAEEASTEEAASLRSAAQYARGLGASSLRAFAIGALSQLAKAGLGLA